jgi:glycosyltransferase involved in cell wall biosynthesis
MARLGDPSGGGAASQMTAIHLSVVVCTYNRMDLLAGCLDSLAGQTLPADRFEVIVVDNNSVDGTSAVVRACRAGRGNLRYVVEARQGLSHARNRGCQEAVGTHLVYLDDDARVPPTYLASVCRVLERHDPDIVGGPVFPFYTSTKPRWFKDEYEIRRYADESGFSTTCGISGSNFIIRKPTLQRLGGFDPSLGMRGAEQRFGEERKVLETYREVTPIGEQRVYYDLDCVVLHHVPDHKMRVRYMVVRGFRAGRMTVSVTRRGATAGSFTGLVVRYPLSLGRMLRREFARGLRGVDWIEIARTLAIQAGKLVEGVRQVGGSVLRRHR